MKRIPLFLLLACTTTLVAGHKHDRQGVGQDQPDIEVQLHSRAGRLLSQMVDENALLGNFPEYLIPTMEPELCTESECCQADDYASPYRVHHLATRVSSVAGKPVTTFYMRLSAAPYCHGSIDAAGCCQANVQKLWLDVDPNHRVLFASFNGAPSAIDAEQSSLGLGLEPKNAVDLSSVTAEGPLITVTVEGEADALCALSDLAPVKGLCSVVVEGMGTNAACCPQSLSLNSADGSFTPDEDGMGCVSDAASGAFELSLQSVTLPYSEDSSQRSNYTFILSTVGNACNSLSDVNSCCGMDIAGMELAISEGVFVSAVHLASTSVPFTVQSRKAGSTSRTLVLGGLAVTQHEVPPEGLPLLVTVQLPSGSDSVPQLCSAADGSTNHGPCHYELMSSSKLCCPSSDTSSVVLGSNVLSPPPPGAVAPPPVDVLARPPPTGTTDESPPPPEGEDSGDGECNSNLAVPVTDTSIGLQYYEGPGWLKGLSNFVFMLSNHNSNTCTKPYCQQFCSWTLFIREHQAARLSFTSDDSGVGIQQQLTTGANASITFSGMLNEGTLLFTVTTAARGLQLSQICQPGALPGQGSKACAAVLRGQDAYSVVYFDQNDVIIQPPTEITPKQICATSAPMSSSCLQVSIAQYNYFYDSSSDSTIFDFKLGDFAAQHPDCVPLSGAATFLVLLSSQATQSGKIQTNPSYGEVTGYTGGHGGVGWRLETQSAPGHYTFKMDGRRSPSDVCAQGITSQQPAGSCVVSMLDTDDCFGDFVTVNQNSSLVWIVPTTGSSDSSRGAIIGVAVGVPLGILLLALLSFFIVGAYRRRRQSNGAAAAAAARENMQWDSFDALAAPLTSGISADDLSQSGSGGGVPVRTSEVQVLASSSPIR